MAQIKTNLQYGVTGSLQTANVANDAIGLAQMATGTDGNPMASFATLAVCKEPVTPYCKFVLICAI
jgi:hypothetical protein